jgi:membrane associated rhomboid family serine protease
MNSNMMLAYGKLLFFPIVLPVFVTFLHFQYKCTQKGLVFVEAEAASEQELAGMYFKPSHAPRYSQKSIWWDSIFLFQPDVTALASHLSSNHVTGQHLDFLPNKNGWCFMNKGASHPTICQATLEGTWNQPGTNATTLSIISSVPITDAVRSTSSKGWFFSFFGSVGDDSSSKPFRRNPNQRIRRHRNLQWLLDHPSTVFWVGLNIGVAACLAYFKVPALSVGKLYSNMLHEGEIWRIWTGATAHYQIWHLGLNMMGLLSLGSQLEGGEFSSVDFFLYNMSMIPLVGAVWLGLQYGVKRLRRTSTSPDNVPTVGYSGVLYAWLAISAFQSDKGDFLKSFGGMVLYTVIYSAMPGISMTGHMAGVVVGAAYRAHLLPLAYVQPAVLIPVLYFAYCYYIRKLFVVATENGATANNDRWQLGVGGDKSQEFHRILLWCMLCVAVLSLAFFGPQSPLFLSYMWTLVFWYCSVKYSSNTTIQNVLLRGFVLAAVLSVITDAMTVGAWMATYMTSLQGTGTMLLRWLVHLAAISLACHTLAENENRVGSVFEYTRGVFNCTLGWTILAPAQSVGKQLVQRRNKRPDTTLFGGRGQTLGSGSRVPDSESRLEASPSSSPGRMSGTTRRVTEVELAEQGEISQLL